MGAQSPRAARPRPSDRRRPDFASPSTPPPTTASFRRRRSSRLSMAKPPGKTSTKRGEEGTKDEPWTLTTPSGSSEFVAWKEDDAEPPALVVQVGKTQLRYHLRCLEDLH